MREAPLILITPGTERRGAEFYDYSVSLSDPYIQAVYKAGGVPWISPCIPDPKLVAACVERCNGVMLSGGDDIQPGLYLDPVPPELQKTCGEHDPARDAFELMVIQEVFRQGKPLLAICRGFQLVNVALGGTLFVDIPTQAPSGVDHRRMDRKDKVVHSITLEPDSLLRVLLGKAEAGVNSSHHQGIDRLAPGLKVTARAADGMIEATELTGPLLPYYVGMQSHPERLTWKYPEFLELFRSFTEACAADAGGKHERARLGGR